MSDLIERLKHLADGDEVDDPEAIKEAIDQLVRQALRIQDLRELRTIDKGRIEAQRKVGIAQEKNLFSKEQHIEQLEAALKEAMEWNWLDGDVPGEAIVQCKAALQENE